MLKLFCSTMLFTAEWWQNRGSRVINYDDFEDQRIEITFRIISYGSSCHLVSLHWILIITVGVLQMLLQKYIYFNIFEILNKMALNYIHWHLIDLPLPEAMRCCQTASSSIPKITHCGLLVPYMASYITANIGLGKGLAPVHCQIITWSNVNFDLQ